MFICVEFYGIARQRAGVSQLVLDFALEKVRLGDVLLELAQRLPSLQRDCVYGRELAPSFAANLAGERFVRDPATLLHDGDCLILLSADAGG